MNEELTTLISKLEWVKADEAEIKKERLAVENEIIEYFSRHKLSKLEGSVTLEGLTVNYKQTRAIDSDKLISAWENNIPENARKCVKWSADLDLKQYKAMQEFDKESFKIIAEFVTTKPAKPSITLK